MTVFFGIRVHAGARAVPAALELDSSCGRTCPIALAGVGFGYIVPGMVLARLAKRRAHRIRLSLADALDLLVVSVEAGLGLDQALTRVGAELAFAYPDLSDELRLVNLELRAGKPRSEALRNLADRTGVDDLNSLVTMLIQTDKFGTSVAQSLRVYSETLRTKRRQRAEEAAAKTGVKMVFPLVFCIFPAIWVVTIGPAAIKFVTVLFPMIEKTVAMSATAADRPVRRTRRPVPPPPPATLEETGLHPDTLSQLLLKTLVAGEASGTGLADSLRLPYSILDALIQHARIEKLVEVRGASGAGSAGYRYALTDLGRDRAGQFFDDLALRRAGAGAARAVQRLRPGLHGGAAVRRPRAPGDRASRT